MKNKNLFIREPVKSPVKFYKSGVFNTSEFNTPIALWASEEGFVVGIDKTGEVVFEGGISNDGTASQGTWPNHVWEHQHNPDLGLYGPSKEIKQDMILALNAVREFLNRNSNSEENQ